MFNMRLSAKNNKLNFRMLALGLVIFIYGNCSAQNQVEIISLDQIESDSEDQQLTLYIRGFLSYTKINQLTKKPEGWEYIRGLIISKDSVIIFEKSLKKLDAKQLDKYYKALQQIPSQESLILENAEGLSISNSKFFNQINDGTEYLFSIVNEGEKRKVIYNNPKPYLEILKSYGFGTEEHLQIIGIVDYIEKLISS